MDPTPDTPFRDVSDHWVLSLRCCDIVDLIRAYRERHYPPAMTAARLVARLRCRRCGERPREVAWESAHVGPGGLPLDPRRVLVTREGEV